MHPVVDEQAALLCTPGELLQLSGRASSVWKHYQSLIPLELQGIQSRTSDHSHFVVNEHIHALCLWGLVIDPRALCVLGKLSTTELYPQHTKSAF